jgi:hypothetical protein
VDRDEVESELSERDLDLLSGLASHILRDRDRDLVGVSVGGWLSAMIYIRDIVLVVLAKVK